MPGDRIGMRFYTLVNQDETHFLVLSVLTPQAVVLSGPGYFAMAGSSGWCFVLAENPHSQALENISARVELVDAGGRKVAVELAITPSNMLPVEKTMPMIVYFLPPLPARFTPHVD